MAFTLFRLILGPAFFLARARDMGWGVLMVIVGLAILTDWLDGFLARRWHVVTAGGKLLDPFADALFCMIALYDCWRTMPYLLPGWIFFAMVAREGLVTLVLRPVSLWHGLVMGANILGKVKTGLQFAVIVAFVLLQSRPAMGAGAILAVGRVTAGAALAFSLISAAVYVRAGWKELSRVRGIASRGSARLAQTRQTGGA